MGKSPGNIESIAGAKEAVNGFKNKRIEVRMGMTINMGDYNSHRIELGMSADIDDFEDISKAYEAALIYVEEKLSAEASLVNSAAPVLKRIRKANGPTRRKQR